MIKCARLIATAVLSVVAFNGQSVPASKAKNSSGIRIIEATFGDQVAHKTCTPDLSICKSIANCSFTVGDMCTIDSQVKNLEVTWDCGEGTEKHARAAAKDTKISLSCAN
jgi:hypothetical protein